MEGAATRDQRQWPKENPACHARTGANQEILAKPHQGVRDQVFISTKVFASE